MSVKEVYNDIAKEFDRTRRTVWVHVANFLDTLEKGSLLLDNGCGNGKNMLYRKDLFCVGIDISKGQVEVCRGKKLKVVEGSMVSLPFEDNTFEAMLCTASYHHLQKDTERQQALTEMYRCLKSKGRVLLTVWASEGETSEDTMVPWKLSDGTVKYRYYRKYVKGDLEEEVKRLEPRFLVSEGGFDKGNWFVVLTK
jgi:ubiquinone/menaquinone biosynthesis C-methylase UbiE